jgi:hypothetical protein
MSWRFQLQALFSVCLLACLASSMPAQEQSSSDDTVYNLHGVVLNGVTGKPIDRALVYSMDQRLATMTNGEGKFAISVRVPQKTPGDPKANSQRNVRLSIAARKPTYVPDNIGKEVMLDDSINSTDYELKLMPGASVEGHVVPDGALPRQGIQMILMSRMASSGEFVWRASGAQMTDKQGSYHFGGLRPGTYMVEMPGFPDSSDMPPLPGKTTQQFPTTYFGDSLDMESATRIHLHYGDAVQADLHVRRVTGYPVVIPVAASVGGLVVRATGKDQFGSTRFTYHADEAAYEGSLPNGSYNLLISNGPQNSTAEVTVHVEGGPVRTAPLTLVPSAVATARVQTQFTKISQQNNNAITRNVGAQNVAQAQQRAPLVQVTFVSSENGGGSFGSALPEGESPLNALNPGKYTLEMRAMRGYVASATLGSTDLTQNPLVVAPGGKRDPIEIILRDDMATVSGKVNAGGAELPSAISVEFIPLDATARISQTVFRDANFTNPRLAPGTYRVLAFAYTPSTTSQIAYRDAETLRKLEGKGVTVSVGPDETKQIEVPLLDASILEDN